MTRTAAAMLMATLFIRPAPTAAQTPAATAPAPGAPGDTRLLLGPTGRMLEPGRGYVALDGFLVSANVGVTPWLSLGAGTPVIPPTDGSFRRPYWVIPKVRLLARDRTSVALCVAHAVVSRDTRLGVAYVVGTRGTADRSITVGGALAYIVDKNHAGDDYTGAAAAFLIGGERRISPRWFFLTENYLTTEGGLLSAGFRFSGRHFVTNLSALSMVAFGDGVIVLPVVTFGWKF